MLQDHQGSLLWNNGFNQDFATSSNFWNFCTEIGNIARFIHSLHVARWGPITNYYCKYTSFPSKQLRDQQMGERQIFFQAKLTIKKENGSSSINDSKRRANSVGMFLLVEESVSRGSYNEPAFRFLLKTSLEEVLQPNIPRNKILECTTPSELTKSQFTRSPESKRWNLFRTQWPWITCRQPKKIWE